MKALYGLDPNQFAVSKFSDAKFSMFTLSDPVEFHSVLRYDNFKTLFGLCDALDKLSASCDEKFSKILKQMTNLFFQIKLDITPYITLSSLFSNKSELLDFELPSIGHLPLTERPLYQLLVSSKTTFKTLLYAIHIFDSNLTSEFSLCEAYYNIYLKNELNDSLAGHLNTINQRLEKDIPITEYEEAVRSYDARISATGATLLMHAAERDNDAKIFEECEGRFKLLVTQYQKAFDDTQILPRAMLQKEKVTNDLESTNKGLVKHNISTILQEIEDSGIRKVKEGELRTQQEKEAKEAAELSKLEQDLSKKQRKLSHREEKLRDSSENQARIRAILQNFPNEINNLRVRIESLEASRVTLQDITSWQSQLPSLENSKGTTESQLNMARSKLDDITSQFDSRISGVASPDTNTGDDDANRRNQEEYDKTIESLKQQKESEAFGVQREVDSLSSALDTIVENISNLQKNIEEAFAKNEQVDTDVQNARQAIQDCERQLQEAQSNAMSVDNEVTKYENKIEKSHSKIKHFKKEIDGVNSRLKATRSKVSELKECLEFIQAKVRLEAEILQTNAALAYAQTKHENRLKIYNEIKSQKEETEKELHEKDNVRLKSRTQYNQTAASLDMLNTERNERQKILDTARQEKETIQKLWKSFLDWGQFDWPHVYFLLNLPMLSDSKINKEAYKREIANLHRFYLAVGSLTPVNLVIENFEQGREIFDMLVYKIFSVSLRFVKNGYYFLRKKLGIFESQKFDGNQNDKIATEKAKSLVDSIESFVKEMLDTFEDFTEMMKISSIINKLEKKWSETSTKLSDYFNEIEISRDKNWQGENFLRLLGSDSMFSILVKEMKRNSGVIMTAYLDAIYLLELDEDKRRQKEWALKRCFLVCFGVYNKPKYIQGHVKELMQIFDDKFEI